MSALAFVLAAAASPPEPDSLGGLTLGGSIPAVAVRHDEATLWVDVAIAGHSGRLFIDECRGRIHNLRWRTVANATGTDVGADEAAWIFWAQNALDAIRGRNSSMNEAMQSAGWSLSKSLGRKETRRNHKQLPIPHDADPITFAEFRREGTVRTTAAWCHADVCVFQLSARTPTACVAGL